MSTHDVNGVVVNKPEKDWCKEDKENFQNGLKFKNIITISKWIASTLFFTSSRILSLLAVGSTVGLAGGFNAIVASYFFVVESVLWPSDSNSSLSLTYSTSTVILSVITTSDISEIGLGFQPTFHVPDYDFHSPAGN